MFRVGSRAFPLTPRRLLFAAAVGLVAAVVAGGMLSAQQARGVVTDVPDGDVIIGPGDNGGSATCATPCPTATGDAIFLKVDGIPGESTHAHHPDEIVVKSWSWGMDRGNKGEGGRGAGKADVKELVITKEFDKSSPELMKALAEGKHLKEVELKVHRASGGGEGVDYLTVKLTDVVVSGYRVNQNDGGAPTEQISFNFAKVEVKYQEQRPGGGGDTKQFKWDVKKNQGF